MLLGKRKPVLKEKRKKRFRKTFKKGQNSLCFPKLKGAWPLFWLGGLVRGYGPLLRLSKFPDPVLRLVRIINRVILIIY